MKQRSMAVYCGHQMGKNPDFKRDAVKMGTLMAKNDIRLVFGGGHVGLMGTVADAALEHGGKVIGISTPHVIARQEPMHKGIKSEIVSGINERKQRMFELSDAFCILTGGLGTLNEVTDVMTMQQVGESQKPIYFVNTDGYWNIFGRTMQHMLRAGFIADMNDYNMHVFDTPEEVIKQYLKHFSGK